ncbi:hypothetical protein L218DRAFT_994298 [Marasmius fiardii PR-910]|nr:hypothetical protein L218DRAFT_994298 [Marasmius fiardii PR-910]
MTQLLSPPYFSPQSHRTLSLASGSSTRATYVRSHESYMAILDQTGSKVRRELANLQADVEHDIGSWKALEAMSAELSPMPPPPHALFVNRKPSPAARPLQLTRNVDSDSISVLTTRTTTSNLRGYKPRRKAEGSLPLLGNAEMGRSVPLLRSCGVSDKERGSEQPLEKPTPTEQWKGPSRLRGRLGSLFSRRKENAGILDRDVIATVEVQKLKSKSKPEISRPFKLIAKAATPSSTAPVVHWFPTKGDLDLSRTPARPLKRRPRQNLREAVDRERTQALRRSRSFAGFRDSTIVDAQLGLRTFAY